MMKDLEEEQYGDGNSTLITLNISYRKQEIYIFIVAQCRDDQSC